MTIRFRSAPAAIVAGAVCWGLAVGVQAQPAPAPTAVPPSSRAADEEPDKPPAPPPTDEHDDGASAQPTTPPGDEAELGANDIAAARSKLDGLPERIDRAKALIEGLVGRIGELRGRNTITPDEATQYTDVLAAQRKALKSSSQTIESLKKTPAARQAALPQDVDRVEHQIEAVDSTLQALSDQLTDIAHEKGWSLVDKLLEARCATAICFANGQDQYWLGIEPLVELPVGISSAIGNTSLADYINNHELRVDLAAGLRVWLFDDVVSISVYLSKALIDSKVRAVGSDFVYPGSAVRRAFPGFAIGLLFDSIWVGFDRNELRNGDSDNAMSFNSDFPPNSVVTSAWTITVALQPVTAFRTAIGTAKKASEGD